MIGRLLRAGMALGLGVGLILAGILLAMAG